MSRTTNATEDVRTRCPVTLESWVSTTRTLLALEQQEEIETMRTELTTLREADNPNVLSRLTLAQTSTGLFGRTIVHFALPSRSLCAPKAHHFTVGDLVQVRTHSSTCTHAPTGIVARVEDQSLSIVLEDKQQQDDTVDAMETLRPSGTFILERLVNTATYTKLTRVLDDLAKAEAHPVVHVVFRTHAPTWTTPLPPLVPFNPNLNPAQLHAIQRALASQDVALIHGPPGTGKTTTLVELVLQAVHHYHWKVLVCAPSNLAVDNVLEKLAMTVDKGGSEPLELTRMGHPARVLPRILQYCLDAKIQRADGTDLVAAIRDDVAGLASKLRTSRDKRVRRHVRQELRFHRKDMRQREHKVVREIVRTSDVVFATNVGAASTLLHDVPFDLVVIDEAAQALEVACWIPILKAPRCVLAGDHQQLAPTIKCTHAEGLARTLFDRLAQCETARDMLTMLTMQYRMHACISDWSSHAMYKGALVTCDTVARRRLHQLPQTRIAPDNDLLNAPLVLLDTAGCGLDEDASDAASSKSNSGEARVVAHHVRALVRAGLDEHDVAVITPYTKQVTVLKALLLDDHPRVAIRTVDGFQGCEKEAVVLSLVRSNAARHVGFLADARRLNVAMTRAKRHVAVVCDTETIGRHAFLAALVQYMETYGEVRSAQEYLEVVDGGTWDDKALDTLSRNVARTSKPTKVHGENPRPETAAPAAVGSTECVLTLEELVGTTRTEALDQVDESEDEVHVEDKQACATSVFQMLDVDTGSSEEEREQSEDDQRGVHSSPSPADESVPAANTLLRDLHLSRLARESSPRVEPSAGHKKTTRKKKKHRMKTCTTTNVGPIDEATARDDDLAFLTRQADTNQSCAYEHVRRCPKKTTMFGAVCKFCKLKFCYTHVVPEVHGCGNAVRKFEQVAFEQKQPRSNQVTRDTRKQLKKKLEEKVSAKTASRTAQLKSKKRQ
ncbi:hypothetical protein PsorP6_015603 [Peronosclerospora sorghi]|uniref:Uncharacterized protein n=1 Tax=Peronosclerospora sorghi TaxID=230839 RepID=A0ACC0WPX2_9STRA|nr:hypothetical protein PsorP6_015603 [Peronosclerospora sorghi]